MVWRRHKKKLLAALGLVLAFPAAHGVILASTRMTPPAVHAPDPVSSETPTVDPATGIARLGGSYTRVREGLREAYLEGDPERIGAMHARLLRDRMIEDEQAVWSDFTRFVPFAPARVLLTDMGRLRYNDVDQGFPETRRRELAAEAAAFTPDPFAEHMPTYQRFVFLNALYDIALGFEHSPLLGCSAFVLGPDATVDGHTLVGRAFDFEINDVFDRDKAVFLVAETGGAIPFASVAWPGLLGVLTGMNAEGVAVMVNGARAGTPRSNGVPVVASLREVLEKAHDVKEAVAVLKAQPVLVSHIVLVVDAAGRSAVVERVPGDTPEERAFVRDVFPDPSRVAVTNHFEGPNAADPKNAAVRERSTTVPRRARLDEMLAGVAPKSADVPRAVAMLRDHQCAAGVQGCALGDRRAIDGLIATHGVVFDTTARALWVSAGPHLSGKFVKIDLRAIFAPGHDPAKDPPPETIGEDPILHDGRYEAGRAHVGGPHFEKDNR